MDGDLQSAAPVRAAETDTFFRVNGAFAGGARPIPGGGITRWILTEGPRFDHEVEFFDELCWRLLGSGLPISRGSLHFGTLHPQIRGLALRWWRDRGETEDIQIAHGSEGTDEYLRSPIRVAVQEGVAFRCRLDQPTPDYPLLSSLRERGGTDYLAVPLNKIYRRFPVVAWLTDAPGGFTEEQIASLHEIAPALAAIVETRAVRRIGANLLDTYLGAQAARRVLEGNILRGVGEQLRAVIMSTDLRGFTSLSDRLSGEAMIELLDEYFDAMASPIHERQGEVLKFIGDGVLAIFPAEDGQDFSAAASRALEAATTGLARLDRINAVRRGKGLAEINTGVGLHLGEVIYGNVGSVDRLDFTAIGPAVNLASRLEGLTKRLMRPLVTSRDFALACPQPLVSLGFQPVRGLGEPEEVFGL